MSDRIRDYRDPFWSARDRRIRRAHLDAIGTWDRVKELDAEIARKRRAEDLQQYRDDVYSGKGRLLAELATSTVAMREPWARRVESIDLTSASALDELGQLREEVERHGRLFAFTPNLSGLDANLFEAPNRSVNPVVLRLQLEAEERAAQTRAAAEQLDAIKSSLADLIDAVRRYEAARG